MRMRGGRADEIGCALETGCAEDAAEDAGEDADALAGDEADFAADEDFARLRFGGRFLVALAADFLAAEMGRAAIVAAGADDFAARVADDDATGGAEGFGARAGDFAERVEDDDAAMVVPSPKANLSAASIAAGDASFERLRLLERVLFVRAADFLAAAAGDAGADAFRFSCMGVCGARRADDWRFRQARDVVESEDRAEKRVVMCGAEEFAAASRSCAGQPGWAARAERYDGDAVRRHGFE